MHIYIYTCMYINVYNMYKYIYMHPLILTEAET